jgi:hypothetical protein
MIWDIKNKAVLPVLDILCLIIYNKRGQAVAYLVETLRYKPESREFESR